MLTRLECVNNYHYIFWQVELLNDSTILITRWGRIGTTGQTKTYEFASRGFAFQEFHKKVAEKRRKGYVEVATSGSNLTAQINKEVQEETKPTGHRSLSQWMSL